MTYARALAIAVVGLGLSSQVLYGQELSRYRQFQLGSSVASVLMATGVPATSVKVLHERPALLQDIEWRPSRWVTGSVAASTDPVDQMRFSFYDDQLFRIVIDYSRERTVGLTDADLIEAVSTVYGRAVALSRNAAGRVPSRLDSESGAVIARWRDDNDGVALYRTASYGDTWRLIVTNTAVEALARRAESQAKTLDALEAPQREIDRQLLERERDRAAADKARGVNKPAFQP
jgi:hypothetical protein